MWRWEKSIKKLKLFAQVIGKGFLFNGQAFFNIRSRYIAALFNNRFAYIIKNEIVAWLYETEAIDKSKICPLLYLFKKIFAPGKRVTGKSGLSDQCSRQINL